MKAQMIVFSFLLPIFVQVDLYSDGYIQYIPETGDYKISYYQENGEFFETIFEPATKINPFVHCVVHANRNLNYYIYYYRLTNSITSKQRLRVFSLEFFSPLIEVMSPNLTWRVRYFRFASILDWANSKGESGLCDPKDGIAPDSSQGGFGIKSTGLPTIVTCYFMGAEISHSFALTEDMPDEVEEFVNNHTRFPANTVQRKTLGPKDPPIPFIPMAFLDSLISYTLQSRDLGWIINQPIKDKYENYFRVAQSALQQNRLSETKEVLNQVLQNVQSDSGSGLTSEAYALFYYNTEYLLSQLKELELSLDDLIAYIKQAKAAWKIDAPGIANSLIAKLETAKKQLEQEKLKQAVNALNAFLNELEAQHEKHITDEVYLYLKEKVEALIKQIGSSG